MTVRRATEQDIGVVNRLLRQVLDIHHEGRPDIFKKHMKKYTDEQLKELFKDDFTPVFVAEEKGVVYGYAFCKIIQRTGHNILTDVKTLYLDDLCVDERSRGMKVGTTLFDYVQRYAKAQGCYNLTLNVWACNPTAAEFYRKMGLTAQKTEMEKIL